jgi:hypothetical protein
MGISGLIYVLDVAEVRLGTAPDFSLLISIGKKMGQNAEDIEALSVRMKHLMDILEAVSPAKTRPKEVTERFEKLGRCVLTAVLVSPAIKSFSSILVGVSEEVKQRKSGGFFKRLLNHKEDVLWVSERIKAVAEAIGDFKVCSIV